MACWLYEGVLLFGVLVAASLLFSVPAGYRGAADDPRRHIFAAYLFVVLGLYFVWFWTRGQTLAMKTWRINVVDRHGAPLRPGRAALRFLFCWIWFIPPLAALQSQHFSMAQLVVLASGWVVVWALCSRLHPRRQFWHDVLAGTRLVTVSRPG
ncbi:MAG: RDD family protein [Ramlibacter sp.]